MCFVSQAIVDILLQTTMEVLESDVCVLQKEKSFLRILRQNSAVAFPSTYFLASIFNFEKESVIDQELSMKLASEKGPNFRHVNKDALLQMSLMLSCNCLSCSLTLK